jgi:hypothetical protein
MQCLTNAHRKAVGPVVACVRHGGGSDIIKAAGVPFLAIFAICPLPGHEKE